MAGSAPNVDLKARLSFAQAIPVALYATGTTTTTTGIDLAGFESACVVAQYGANGSGDATITVTECDTVAGSYTTVAAANLSGAFTAAYDTANTEEVVGLIRTQQFIKISAVQASVSGTTAGLSVVIVEGAARHL